MRRRVLKLQSPRRSFSRRNSHAPSATTRLPNLSRVCSRLTRRWVRARRVTASARSTNSRLHASLRILNYRWPAAQLKVGIGARFFTFRCCRASPHTTDSTSKRRSLNFPKKHRTRLSSAAALRKSNSTTSVKKARFRSASTCSKECYQTFDAVISRPNPPLSAKSYQST